MLELANQNDSTLEESEKNTAMEKVTFKSALGLLSFIFLGAFLAVCLSDKVTDVIAKDSVAIEHYLVR